MLTADAINWELPPSEPEAQPTDVSDLTVEALIEAQSYRLLAQRLLHHLHDVQVEREVLREQRRIDRSRARAGAQAAV